MDLPKFLLYLLGIMVLSVGNAWAGSTTLTSYYPSPTGYYNQLFASNVGIGTTVPPTVALEVNGTPYFHTNYHGTFPVFGSGIGSQGGTAIGWNGQFATTGQGETDFINFKGTGGGTGGFEFSLADDTGTVPSSPAMVIYPPGNVGIGTTVPDALLNVHGQAIVDNGLTTQGNAKYPPKHFGGSLYSAYGDGLGGATDHTSPEIIANGDDHTGGGVGVSDDGGFFDWNDGWISYQGVSGLKVAGATGPSSSGLLYVLGNVGIGTTAPGWPLSEVSNTTPGIELDGFALHSASPMGTYLRIFSGNGTQAFPTNLLLGDELGAVAFTGYWTGKPTATFLNGDARALISGVTTEAWSGASHNGAALAFDINPNASGNALKEAMRIDQSGNVGIGTPIPAQNLDISQGTMRFEDQDDAAVSYTLTSKNETANGVAYGRLVLNSSGLPNGSRLWIEAPTGAGESGIDTAVGGTEDLHLGGLETGGGFINLYNGPFAINEQSTVSPFPNTNLVTVLANGSVGIGGLTAPDSLLEVNGVSHLGNDVNLSRTDGWTGGSSITLNSSASGTGDLYLQLSGGGNINSINLNATTTIVRGNLTVNQNITASAGCITSSTTGCFSDERLKQNIEPLTGALSKLDQLRGVSFEWNHLAASVGNEEGKKSIGMIAQEMQKVYPELVSADKTRPQKYLTIDYAKFTAVLLQSIKELKTQMGEMQDQINALQDKVKTLEKQK